MVKLTQLNSETEFVLKSVNEFINAWGSSKDVKLSLKSKDGKAWISFNCCLGDLSLGDNHKKRRKKSQRKRKRDSCSCINRDFKEMHKISYQTLHFIQRINLGR